MPRRGRDHAEPGQRPVQRRRALDTELRQGEIDLHRGRGIVQPGQRLGVAPAELRLRLSDSETKTYAQAHGWLQVFGSHARLLIEEAISPEDLDAASLKEQLADAERRLGESEQGSGAWGRARKDRDRAEAFLTIAQG